jgi:hypothetical protein
VYDFFFIAVVDLAMVHLIVAHYILEVSTVTGQDHMALNDTGTAPEVVPVP